MAKVVKRLFGPGFLASPILCPTYGEKFLMPVHELLSEEGLSLSAFFGLLGALKERSSKQKTRFTVTAVTRTCPSPCNCKVITIPTHQRSLFEHFWFDADVILLLMAKMARHCLACSFCTNLQKRNCLPNRTIMLGSSRCLGRDNKPLANTS